jgi:hypothetical protein
VPLTLYQDRLSDGKGGVDRRLTWALGAITGDTGEAYGVVLVAFSGERLNRAVAGKLAKGLGITLFFVALILVQNLVARRGKLRLLDLEAALAAARRAIRSALPAPPRLDGGELGIAVEQAERVGGTLYDIVIRKSGALEVLLAVPAGAGVDAAFASVVLRDLYRRDFGEGELGAEVERLMRAYDAAPLGRTVELLVLRLFPDGRVEGVTAGPPPPARIADGRAVALALGPPLPVEARRLAAPLRQFAAPPGSLALWNDGLPADAPRRFSADEALARMAEARGRDAQAIAADTVAAAAHRDRHHTDDFFALVFRRSVAAE